MITAKLPRATFEAQDVQQSNTHFAHKTAVKAPDCIWSQVNKNRSSK